MLVYPQCHFKREFTPFQKADHDVNRSSRWQINAVCLWGHMDYLDCWSQESPARLNLTTGIICIVSLFHINVFSLLSPVLTSSTHGLCTELTFVSVDNYSLPANPCSSTAQTSSENSHYVKDLYDLIILLL